MRDELLAFGWRPSRLLTVISDGEPALPNLIRNANDADGQVKHILDWWHISMRVRHLEVAVQGLVQADGFSGQRVFCSSDPSAASAGACGTAEQGSQKPV